jgi:hypothetical protein
LKNDSYKSSESKKMQNDSGKKASVINEKVSPVKEKVSYHSDAFLHCLKRRVIN